ncbi:MAG: histidinol phosphatase [Actinobacteria bacterium]|nr:histidinol phosphatase [Actinomycetota bacterium]MTA89722.1 histidinol phosphatase [Actinomycetota bacterium]
MNDLQLALALADAADQISLTRFKSLDLNVETKPDRTPVTDADKSVEAEIRKLIAEAAPEDAVIGEEYENTGSGLRAWIIDPIDGTANFLRGIPIWATLIALKENGVLTTSVVSAPALGRRWWATKGAGAWTQDVDGSVRRISVSAVSDLADSYISYNSLQQWQRIGKAANIESLSEKVWRIRAFGDFLSYMYVAEGAIDAASEPDLKIYDIAALVPIVEEAGGRFTDLSGELTAESSNVLASNGLIHEAIRAELNR